ncbi:MAG: glycosyltransferase family 4 protein [Planctomycetota bacterium]
MRVGVDLSPLAGGLATGVERSLATLLPALRARAGLEIVPLEPEGALPALWRETTLPRRVRREGLALVYSGVAAVPLRAGCPVIATLHDLPGATAPASDRRLLHRARVALAARVAARIVCVSQRTRADFLARQPAAEARSVVIAPGVAPCFAPASAPARAGAAAPAHAAGRADAAGPGFVLAVGRLRRRKNLGRLISAFALARHTAGLRLLLVGPEGDAASALRAQAARAELKGRVEFLGAVSDEALVELYRGARCLAMPSLLEGFGLPVLEAMACGTPVVASRQGAVPELAEQAVESCDGESVPDLARALDAVLNDPARAAHLRSAGLLRAEEFRSERSAAALHALFEAVVAESRHD